MTTLFEQTLQAMADPIKQSAAQGFANWARQTIENWKADSEKFGTTNPIGKVWVDGQRVGHRSREVSPFIRLVDNANKYIKPDFELRPDVDDIIATRAARHGEAVAEEFAAKLKMKLKKILAASPAVEVKASGTWSRNVIQVVLQNGVAFNVQSQIVSVWPSNGTPFHRYPTTFHRLTTKDGTKGGASLAQVEKAVNAANQG